MSGGGQTTVSRSVSFIPFCLHSRASHNCWFEAFDGIRTFLPASSLNSFTGDAAGTTIADPSRWPSETSFTLTFFDTSEIASGALRNAAPSLPSVRSSHIVGNSEYFRLLKIEPESECRVVQSTTGHVRWHVTGRKPTTSCSRSWPPNVRRTPA